MLEELRKTKEDGPAVAAYLWNVALLGLTSARVPPARTADGGEVVLPDVLSEIARKGRVWVSRRAGSVEGAFPDSPPGFVLHDEGSPLLHVLRHRAPESAIRELGGIEVGPAAAHVNPAGARDYPQSVVLSIQSDRIPRRDELGLAGSPAPSAPSTAGPAGPSLPWLERLRQRVALLFMAANRGGAAPLPEPNALCTALLQALGELGLVGGPVHLIIESKSGPAIRYEKHNKRVLLNRRHRALLWLQSSDPPSARALCVLLAAIVSEVNRALGEVTDAEERRVLLQLLRTVDSY
jgi:hypothetical protein